MAALCSSLSAGSALAQTGAAPATSNAPSAPGPLLVFVDAPEGSLDRARLTQSLSTELRRDVTLVSETEAAVRIHVEGARAQVRYTTPSNERLERSVELPPDAERSVQVVSWLTVNLVRDEASELLGELRARRREEEEARAAREKAEAEQAARDKAAADKAAADKAAADKAAQAAKQPSQPPRDELLRDPLRSFDLALVTPLSLIRDSGRRELYLQAALAYGESGAIRGAALSMAALRVRRDVQGAALAPGFVLVGGDVHGLLGSMGYARLEGRLEGAEIAIGLASARAIQGLLVAGGVTLLRDPSRGIMVAGGANVAGDLIGAQLSAGVNVARDLRGLAIAPINTQKRVTGIQLGVVNVAEEVDGVAIGIISWAKNGRVQPVFWGSSDRSAHLAIKSIAGYAFTQLGGGVSLNGERVSYDGGIGAHLELGSRFFLEPGLHYSGSFRLSQNTGELDRHELSYLLGAGFRAGNKLDVLVAAGAKHTVVGEQVWSPELRGGLAFF